MPRSVELLFCNLYSVSAILVEAEKKSMHHKVFPVVSIVYRAYFITYRLRCLFTEDIILILRDQTYKLTALL